MLGEALKHAEVALPACALCIHRFALLLPPATHTAAMESETQRNSLGNAVAGLFMPGLPGATSRCMEEANRQIPPPAAIIAQTNHCLQAEEDCQEASADSPPPCIYLW